MARRVTLYDKERGERVGEGCDFGVAGVATVTTGMGRARGQWHENMEQVERRYSVNYDDGEEER